MTTQIREQAAFFFPKLDPNMVGTSNPITGELLGRIEGIPTEPLSHSHFVHYMGLVHAAPVSHGFFRYYLLSSPPDHPYSLEHILASTPALHPQHIASVDQLEWGVKRFYTDALLYFSAVNKAFDHLRKLDYEQICDFFVGRRFATSAMQLRGPRIEPISIPVDDRYLISEIACKAYGTDRSPEPVVLNELIRHFKRSGLQRVPIKQLISMSMAENPDDVHIQLALNLGADEFVDLDVESEAQIHELVGHIKNRFDQARAVGLENTRLYLANAHDLDVYVATSMRTRADFRDMARNCQGIFDDDRLRPYHVRWFDPTLSAASGHEDKGILECVMVDRAKVVIYFAQESESWGKDAEATRALNQGKPVIIYCPATSEGKRRMEIFRDIHPLSRLVHLDTGVVVGAMITDDLSVVRELLLRLFTNRMQYDLEQTDGYFRLRELLSGSVVRLQTGDSALRRALDEYYPAVQST